MHSNVDLRGQQRDFIRQAKTVCGRRCVHCANYTSVQYADKAKHREKRTCTADTLRRARAYGAS